jgi:hypothetical protein
VNSQNLEKPRKKLEERDNLGKNIKKNITSSFLLGVFCSEF